MEYEKTSFFSYTWVELLVQRLQCQVDATERRHTIEQQKMRGGWPCGGDGERGVGDNKKAVRRKGEFNANSGYLMLSEVSLAVQARPSTLYE